MERRGGRDVAGRSRLGAVALLAQVGRRLALRHVGAAVRSRRREWPQEELLVWLQVSFWVWPQVSSAWRRRWLQESPVVRRRLWLQGSWRRLAAG